MAQKLFRGSIFVLLLLACLGKSNQDTSELEQPHYELPYGCPYSRSHLFDRAVDYNNSFAYSQTQGVLSLNGTEFIEDYYLYNLTIFQMYDKYQDYQGEFVEYVLLFIIPYVFGLILLPFLCRCFICPNAYACCTGKIGPKIGACILSALSILLFGSVSVGLLILPSVDQVYSTTTCSAGLILQGLMNGTTLNQRTFLGMHQIVQVMDQAGVIEKGIADKLMSISSQGNLTQKLVSHIQQYSAQIDNITVDEHGNQFSLNYFSPIDSSNPKTKVSSLIPELIGKPNIPDTIIGITKYILKHLNDSFVQDVLPPLNAILLQLHYLNGTINILNDTLQLALRIEKNFDGNITEWVGFTQESILPVAYPVYYGVLATVAVICVMLCFGAMLSGYSDKYQFRYLLYCGCGLSISLSAIILTLGIGFSAATLGAYYHCEYLGPGTRDIDFFKNHWVKMFTLDNQMTVCIADGDGDIIKSEVFFYQNISMWVDLRNSVEEQFKSYKTPYYINQTIRNYYAAIQQIQGLRTGSVMDLKSASDISILEKIADPSSFPTCTAHGFKDHSWIPSIHQDIQYLPCKVTGPFSDNSTCPTRQSLEDKENGCVGCMDTFTLFENYTPEQIEKILQARYPGCSKFATSMSNVWKNYYSEKNTKIKEILDKFSSLDSMIETLVKDVHDIDQAFIDALEYLDENFNLLMNETIGVITAVNCRPVGDSIEVAVDLACTTHLPFSFGARITMGVIAWSLLFFTVLATYLGTNAYKMSKIRRDESLLSQSQSLNSSEGQGSSDSYFRHHG